MNDGGSIGGTWRVTTKGVFPLEQRWEVPNGVMLSEEAEYTLPALCTVVSVT